MPNLIPKLPSLIGGNKGKAHLKNHVSKYGRVQEKQLKDKVGVNTNLIYRALTGDVNAMRKLGNMGMEGKTISDNAATVQAATLAAIQGTEDLNTVLAAIYEQGGKSGIEIEKAILGTQLGAKVTANKLGELQTEYDLKDRKEDQRHTAEEQLASLKAWLEITLDNIDNRYKFNKERLSLEEKQEKIDRDHNKALGSSYLKEGDIGQERFTPRKQLPGVPIVDRVVEFIRGF